VALELTSVASLAGQGSVPLTCTGAPAHATCVASPNTPFLGQTVAITVTVATGVAANILPPSPFASRTAPVLLALLLPVAWIFGRRRRLGRLFVLLLAAVSLSACATSRYIPSDSTSTSTPTPPGTYNLIVTGSAAGLTHSVGLTLIVQ
jgi:hypothetical protein